MNALKHGLTAQEVILPNEDPEAFDALLGEWLDDFPPANAAEQAVIERAVQSQWKLRRAARSERAALAKRVRHAVVDFDRDETIRAEELGRRLMHDPLDRNTNAPDADPPTREALAAWHNDDDPPKLTQELQSSLHGVDWMLNQWRELDGLLDREGYWHYNDKFRALRLMGKRPHDVLDEFEIAMTFVASHAAHPEPWDLWDEVYQARMGTTGKPMYNRRVHYLKEFQYTEENEPTLELRRLVERKVANLQTLRETLAPMAELDRAEAADRAMFDDTAAGVLHRRYETACERELHRSIADLTKLRKGAGEPRRAASADPTGRRHRPLRNEPTPDARTNPSNPQTQPFPMADPAPNDAG
jgi:hypothetical protein